MISMGKKGHLMRNISKHKIRRQLIVLVQGKFVEIQQVINFIMVGKVPELILPSGLKDLSFKGRSMGSLIMQYSF